MWTSQVKVPLTWTKAFLARYSAMKREFYIADYMGEGKKIRITADASPWCLGAYLEEDGCITE